MGKLRGLWGGRGLSTTARLLMGMVVSALCVLALWALLAADLGAVRDGFGAIGTGSGPEVEACAQLYDDVADMDARAADLLLLGDGATPTASNAGESAAIQKDQADADTRLEIIGSGIDANPHGAAEFIALENGLSQYSQDISQAFYIDGLDHGRAAGRPPAAALTEYQKGDALLRQDKTGVFFEAQALLTGYQDSAAARYSGVLGTIGQLRLWGLLLVLLVIGVLIAAQGGLNRRFKRSVNPLLALATLLTAVFGVLLTSGLDTAHDAYVQQKSEALDSAVALWQARALAADMDASEGRWLLAVAAADPGSAADQVVTTNDEAQFRIDAEQVAADPADVEEPLASYASDLKQAAETLYSEPYGTAGEFTGGFLGTELSNVTFAGEQHDADAAFSAYELYIGDDANLRGELPPSGSTEVPTEKKIASAVAVHTNWSEHDLADFDTNVDEAISINQQAFGQATAQGADGLGLSTSLPALWALLTLVSIAAGFTPRLWEYRRS